ncbi:hypothetical protein [Yaniella halotolerans]|uniref:hypothetical protein n=1 Tax=Yaniella halotolerans TaxID=225453 RepID=UPI0003B6A462|nr:hypothetical protein [Yaniella halotolerans]
MLPKRIDHTVAAAWGTAEATVFFIVPDVWTSWRALHNPRRGMATTVSALAGALVGGATTYKTAQQMSPEDTEQVLTSIPGISAAMVADVERQLDEQGWSALVLGPTRGVPYKIYARTLAHGNESFGRFMALSVPARMVRFLAVTGGVAGLGKLADRMGVGSKGKAALFLGGWAGFYTWYFTLGPGRRSASDTVSSDEPGTLG